MICSLNISVWVSECRTTSLFSWHDYHLRLMCQRHLSGCRRRMGCCGLAYQSCDTGVGYAIRCILVHGVLEDGVQICSYRRICRSLVVSRSDKEILTLQVEFAQCHGVDIAED